MKSVEKSVPDYSLKSVCTLYWYFFQKIAVLSHNIFCFKFMSSYILIQACTYIHNYIYAVILIQRIIKKESICLVHNLLIQSLQVFEISIDLGLFYC